MLTFCSANAFTKLKKLVVVLMALYVCHANADERFAYEYSSEHDDDHRHHHHHHRHEWHDDDDNEIRRYSYSSRYQRNYQQPKIQIFVSPDLNSYSVHKNARHYDSETREEHRWRERREELQRQPQSLYYENEFYREDTHW